MSSTVSCGIIGLPNVGKSSLFNALTKNSVLVANYPFATIEPNSGVVPVPDPRLDKLAAIYKTDKIIPATIKFTDIAGLVKGASRGEGLGNQFLSHIRNTDLLIHVVRAFKDTQVTHVSENFDPIKDIEVVNTELVLADISTLDKTKEKLNKEAKSNPKLSPKLEEVNKALQYLNDGNPLWSSNIDNELLNDLHLLTTKKIVYIFNLNETDLNNEVPKTNLAKLVEPVKSLFVSAKLEHELNELNESDAKELLSEYGQNESSLISVVNTAYTELGLQSFLTAGEKEVRAWTINKGAKAPEAAGVIHKDFEKGFIAANIASYLDIIKYDGINGVKADGKLRTEGKDYVMRPDDVVLFKFNVS